MRIRRCAGCGSDVDRVVAEHPVAGGAGGEPGVEAVVGVGRRVLAGRVLPVRAVAGAEGGLGGRGLAGDTQRPLARPAPARLLREPTRHRAPPPPAHPLQSPAHHSRPPPLHGEELLRGEAEQRVLRRGGGADCGPAPHQLGQVRVQPGSGLINNSSKQ